MSEKKQRLDIYCSEKGLSSSREKAKKEILAGWVRVNDETVYDPAYGIKQSDRVAIKRPGGVFVSRGGEKLDHAIKSFNIHLDNAVAADLGASTGGFTDCMLKKGAKKVYAVDVGYGQLDYSLQRDKRVIVMDRTNVRQLTRDQFQDPVDFVSVDLSFISVLKVFHHLKELFPLSRGVILIKPQFEADKGEQKKGVVRKKEFHCSILFRVITGLISTGLVPLGLIHSPVKGPAGNIEFLLYFSLDPHEIPMEINSEIIESAVDRAHSDLN